MSVPSKRLHSNSAISSSSQSVLQHGDSSEHATLLSRCKSLLSTLLRPSITQALLPYVHVTPTRVARMSKPNLVAHVERLGMDALRELYSSLRDGVENGALKEINPPTCRQEAEVEVQESHTPDFILPISHIDVSDDTPCFARPSSDAIKSSISDFRSATGNQATSLTFCVVCARETFTSNGTTTTVADIPNSDVLEPSYPHPAHQLSHGGILLHPRSYGENDSVFCCRECFVRLKSGYLPRLALANNMWIGDVPFELQHLSQPEKILISLYVSVAQVYKLYPKSKTDDKDGRKRWASTKLHRGLRGNVSTFPLDQEQISSMLSGVMPNSLDILSSTIGVTFVGPSDQVEQWIEKGLPANFIVRRQRVAAALQWLKANNPLYASITISDERLALLPDSDIPPQIISTTRESDDVSALEAERATYVPSDDNIEEDEPTIDYDMPVDETYDDILFPTLEEDADQSEDPHDDGDDMSDIPPAVPIQALGVVDVSGTSVTDSEILVHALQNAATSAASSCTQETSRIKRGSAFVNEYARIDPATNLRIDGGASNPNHLLGAFPWLFPYGVGGFELERDPVVSYQLHSQYALEYEDRRFRKDLHFIFQVFGVQQKRLICQSAVLQMSASAYSRQQHLINSLSPEDLYQASLEEMQKKPFSNPAVAALRNNLKAVRAKVPGTDESRAAVRSKIWGMTLLFNCPNLWITINPSDTQNPIAQVFAGEQIDLDDFVKTAGPNADRRAQNVAEDPYSSAKFFHFVIDAVIKHLFGVSRHSQGVRRHEGILGFVRGYVGTVEAQGRGSLHVHMLLWLRDNLSSSDMQVALTSPHFRLQMEDYISNVIHADIDNLTDTEIAVLPKVKEIGYARPSDPLDAAFDDTLRGNTRAFARALQYHSCYKDACLVPNKNGKLVCKRRAPWELAAQAWVKSTGEWGPKRTAGLMNNFNPFLAFSLMCNHDIKLLTSGSFTNKITWYITHYATKKQSSSSNISALLAKRLAFHRSKFGPGCEKDRDANKKLLQGCANTLSRDRELSAPEVISYLMGWGDVYESHFFVTIPWFAIVQDLYSAFPDLRPVATDTRILGSTHLGDGAALSSSPSTTIVSESGKVRKLDNLADYRYRGVGLDHLSVLDFFLNTYEKKKPSVSNPPQSAIDVPLVPAPVGPGRPLNQRHDYLPARQKSGMCRVVRTANHETVPRFLGSWFPRNDRPDDAEFYGASMLLLFKPWRSMDDLKQPAESWTNAFQSFRAHPDAPADLPRWLDNIQYFYSCADDARDDSYLSKLDDEFEVGESVDEDGGTPAPTQEPRVITEQEIEKARLSATPERSRAFASTAIQLAKDAGIFTDSITHATPVNSQRSQLNLSGGTANYQKVKSWTKTLRRAVRDQHPDLQSSSSDPSLPSHSLNPSAVIPPGVTLTTNTNTPVITMPTYQILNEGQRRAFDIIRAHLNAHLAGENPPQLLLHVQGRGGTGKSLLIQAITELFQARSCSHLLSKCATSGIAGCQIGGTTFHHWAGLGVGNSTNTSDEIHERRHRNFALKEYGVVDEDSMLDKPIFCKASDAAVDARCRHGNGKANLPFGGMNIILFGDFHQFPPVGNISGALFVPSKSGDRPLSTRGKDLYDQFNKVVILTEQMRCQDPVWDNLLSRLRVGECTKDDIDEVNKLVLTNPECDVPDFATEPWDEAILITTRHAVRKQWNSNALSKHCSKHHQLKFIVPATEEDTQTHNPPSNFARLHLAKHSDSDASRKLEEVVELAIGMKAMVLLNISTEADVANGTRGIIHDIIFDPKEPAFAVVDGVVRLSYLPLAIILKPNNPTSLRFDGLDAGLIPIMPSSTIFQIPPEALGRKGCRIKRTQFAITAAYAFTDYKAQGQTVEHILVDIAKPPRGTMSPFAVYVALSRSRGRGTIRLLRPFDDHAFRNHPSQDLRVEMDRLRLLDSQTRA